MTSFRNIAKYRHIPNRIWARYPSRSKWRSRIIRFMQRNSKIPRNITNKLSKKRRKCFIVTKWQVSWNLESMLNSNTNIFPLLFISRLKPSIPEKNSSRETESRLKTQDNAKNSMFLYWKKRMKNRTKLLRNLPLNSKKLLSKETGLKKTITLRYNFTNIVEEFL